MTIATSAATGIAARKHHFSVEDYHRMAESGIFGQDDRVELIEGEIVEMSPIGTRHAACVARMTRLLAPIAQEKAILGVQNPLTLQDDSEPQPDLALLANRDDFYAEGHPTAEDVLLLIEVADTTAPFDRQVKLPLYARAGVREVWLVDLPGQGVEVHREPSPQGYRLLRRALADDTITPEAFPELEISVADVLA
jgi:Uma2 family endonuclease